MRGVDESQMQPVAPRLTQWVRADVVFLLLALGAGWLITVGYRDLIIDSAQTDYARQIDPLTLSLAQGVEAYLSAAIINDARTDYDTLTEEARRQFVAPLRLMPNSSAWLLRGAHINVIRPDSAPLLGGETSSVYRSISERADTGEQVINQYTFILIGTEQWLVGISTPYSAIMAWSGAELRIQAAFIAMSFVTVLVLIVGVVFQRSHVRQQRTSRALAQATQDRETEQRFATALSNTTNVLAESLDLKTVLASILQNLHRVVPYDSASIVLLEGAYFRVASTQLHNPTVQHETADHIPDPIQPFLIKMQRDKAPRYVPYTEKQADWVVLPREEWVKSHIGYPVVINDVLQGVLNVNSAQPGYYLPHHLTQLGGFATQAAIALRNAQLYAQVQGLADDLQAKVTARTAELSKQNASLQALIDHMSDGLLFVDSATDCVLYINPAFTAITGIESRQIVGQPARDFTWMLADASQVGPLTLEFDEKAAIQKQWQREIVLRTANRGECYCALTGTIVRDAANTPLGYLILIRDISQEKALQAQKDDFITNASHELRNPVQNFNLRLHLLRQQPQRADEHMRVLQESSTRINRLIENLLDLSRFEHGQIRLAVKSVDLVELVHVVLTEYHPLIDSRRVNVEVQTAQSACLVHGDETRLMQVIENLLGNALNYTPEGGQVTIGIIPTAADVMLSVRDTGAGIPAEALTHIFEPFFRVPNQTTKGNGIGLTITKEIIALHGGQITAESTLGVGTVFIVRLPRPRAEMFLSGKG